jgi:hypothetical protein
VAFVNYCVAADGETPAAPRLELGRARAAGAGDGAPPSPSFKDKILSGEAPEVAGEAPALPRTRWSQERTFTLTNGLSCNEKRHGR